MEKITGMEPNLSQHTPHKPHQPKQKAVPRRVTPSGEGQGHVGTDASLTQTESKVPRDKRHHQEKSTNSGLSQTFSDSVLHRDVGCPSGSPHTDLNIRLGSSSSSRSDSTRPADTSGRLDSAGRPASSGYISGASVASTPDRPSSALARGIKITELENKVNPEPVVNEDTELLIDDHLSARKLVCTFEIWDVDNTVNDILHMNLSQSKTDLTSQTMTNLCSKYGAAHSKQCSKCTDACF